MIEVYIESVKAYVDEEDDCPHAHIYYTTDVDNITRCRDIFIPDIGGEVNNLMKIYLPSFENGWYSKSEEELITEEEYGHFDPKYESYEQCHLNYIYENIDREFDKKGGPKVPGYVLGSLNTAIHPHVIFYCRYWKCTEFLDNRYMIEILFTDDCAYTRLPLRLYQEATSSQDCFDIVMNEMKKMTMYYDIEQGQLSVDKVQNTYYEIEFVYDEDEMLDI